MSTAPTLTEKLANVQHVSQDELLTFQSLYLYITVFSVSLLKKIIQFFPLQMPSLIAATIASDKPTDLYLVRDIISILVTIIMCAYFVE